MTSFRRPCLPRFWPLPAVHDDAPPALRNRLGIAVATQVYHAYREQRASARWRKVVQDGADPQRLLWASTGMKEPDARDRLCDEARDGEGDEECDDDSAPSVIARYRELGIDVGALALRLQKEGADAFSQSWHALLSCIDGKRRNLR